jgi:hypothetical protein
MIDRDIEIKKIQEFLQDRGEVKKGPTAFVAPTIQAVVPDRIFQHSDVKMTKSYFLRNKKTKK